MKCGSERGAQGNCATWGIVGELCELLKVIAEILKNTFKEIVGIGK